jgi:hypothetical protein
MNNQPTHTTNETDAVNYAIDYAFFMFKGTNVNPEQIGTLANRVADAAYSKTEGAWSFERIEKLTKNAFKNSVAQA